LRIAILEKLGIVADCQIRQSNDSIARFKNCPTIRVFRNLAYRNSLQRVPSN